MRTLLKVGLFAAAIAAPWVAKAMSVLPPTFDELVSESTRIIRGTVVSSEPFATTLADGKPVVKTRVVWKLERTLKGTDSDLLTLEFLGGKMPDLSVEVPGMPRFEVGDTDYLFLGKNERALCPVIAGDYGRYHVDTDATTGLKRVRHAPDRREALTVSGSAGAPSGASKTGVPDTVPAFEEAIRQRLPAKPTP